MSDYIKPSLKYTPDVIILHCGTNDLRTEKKAEEIENEVINLAKEMKKEDNEIIISGIIARNDSLNVKGSEVNGLLKETYNDNSILYCDNPNISKYNLNASGLHLNAQGTTTLANNF